MGMHLEAERSEEPLVLARGVLGLKDSTELLERILALRGLLERLGADRSLETLKLDRVSGGHQVVVVDQLDEGLDPASLGDLLGAHLPGHLEGVSLNTGSDDVGESLLLGAVVELLNDDNLYST